MPGEWLTEAGKSLINGRWKPGSMISSLRVTLVLRLEGSGKPLVLAGVRMGVLSRIGIALDSELLKRFDHSIQQRGYTNRSEAFRDLIRDRLVIEQTAAPESIVVGTVTLIYDHHAHGITEKLTEAQHAHHDLVVSTSHAHLDHDSCLEVLIVHGKSAQVAQFADLLIGLKGVQHGKLVMTVPAQALASPSEKAHKHPHPHKH